MKIWVAEESMEYEGSFDTAYFTNKESAEEWKKHRMEKSDSEYLYYDVYEVDVHDTFSDYMEVEKERNRLFEQWRESNQDMEWDEFYQTNRTL
jgi:hypothetical protein